MISSEALQQLAEFAIYFGGAYLALRKQNREIHTMKAHVDSQLTKLNGTATYMIHSWPGPAWLKRAEVDKQGNVQFRMVELNEIYAQTYGIPRLDYIGKTDLEAGWDKQTSDRFRDHDLEVWAKGGAIMFTEDIQGGNLKFMKIRLQSADGQLKGVLGYGLPLDMFCPGVKNCPSLNWDKSKLHATQRIKV